MTLVKYDTVTRAVTQYPYSLEQLREDNPRFMIPVKGLTDEALAPFGVGVVITTTPSTIGQNGKTAVESDPIYTNGRWLQQWQIVSISDQQKQAFYQEQAGQVLKKRAQLLGETDWVTNEDVTVDPKVKRAWLGYRSALRDITKQSGYPFSVVWPQIDSYNDYIPTWVTSSQFKKGLAYNSLLSASNSAILNEQNEVLSTEWEYNTKFDRSGELVRFLTKVLDLSSEQLDSIFNYASLQ